MCSCRSEGNAYGKCVLCGALFLFLGGLNLEKIDKQEILDIVFGKNVKKVPEKSMIDNYTEYLVLLHNLTKTLNKEQRAMINKLVSLWETNEIHTALNAFNACVHYIEKQNDEEDVGI